jgi:diguanylate cyclase (GGDEF)-like protein/PAS domain S-box-containing protein
VEQLPAILYVADVGISGRWHYVSVGIEAILGFTPAEWMADPGLWARQMHPDDRARVFSRESELAQPEVPDEYRIRDRDGATVWVRDEAALVTDEHGHEFWHGVILDITDRKRAELELERRAEQQAAVARLGKDALEGKDVVGLMHDALAEATTVVGVRMGAVFEYSPDTGGLALRAGVGVGVGLSARQLGRARGAPGCAETPAQRSARTPAGDPDSDSRLSSPDLPDDLPDGVTGHIEGREGPWGLVWLGGAQDRPLGPADRDFVQALANILADAIQQRASEEEIRYQALHDPLTTLPNRVLFLDCLARALARPSAEIALAVMDVDNFKLVNDSLGHGAGDELLMQIAPRLLTALRPSDVIGRLGGDEFVVLLDRIPGERAARRVAERIVAAFEAPFQLSAGEHFAKASLGIAIAKDTSTPASLLRDADAALYEAKRKGRARFEVFDRAMRAHTVERLSLENDLSRALEREQLYVVYQPIVSLRDASLVSVEALLRWNHHDRGLIAPADFIPIAEESGMIEPIGRWVLETACQQAARWERDLPRQPPLGISVNLSVRQFVQRDLEAAVQAALATASLDPARLCLEITESVLMDQPHRASEKIRRVARLGVRFALDDFGTGYSSLAYLSGLPINGLKVDRSFVRTLGEDQRSRAIITAIVRMAQALDIEVTAEGVETTMQLEALRALECQLAQGFHFHRPLPPEAVSRLLAPAGEHAICASRAP